MLDLDGRNDLGMDANELIHFRDLALLELKRAERYRNFLSLLVLNLSEFLSSAGRRKINSYEDAETFLGAAIERIKSESRETDLISTSGGAKLVMLLPETDCRGAAVAGTRFKSVLTDFLASFLESDYRFEVPMEISSFPGNSGDDRSFRSRLSDALSVS